jgi:hypothetical protein
MHNTHMLAAAARHSASAAHACHQLQPAATCIRKQQITMLLCIVTYVMLKQAPTATSLW